MNHSRTSTGLRAALLVMFAVLGVTGLVGCPAPKVPTGPPPRYEDPPAPSWLDGGVSAPATPATGGPSILDPGPAAPDAPAPSGDAGVVPQS